MAFLIISESIENTIESLMAEKRLCDKVYEQTNDEVYLAKAKDYADKIRTAQRYKKIWDRRTDYQKIVHLKALRPDKYINKCVQISKGIKGVYFDKRTMLFRVQITRLGKRIYLGQFDSPDDALEILKRYI